MDDYPISLDLASCPNCGADLQIVIDKDFDDTAPYATTIDVVNVPD